MIAYICTSKIFKPAFKTSVSKTEVNCFNIFDVRTNPNFQYIFTEKRIIKELNNQHI